MPPPHRRVQDPSVDLRHGDVYFPRIRFTVSSVTCYIGLDEYKLQSQFFYLAFCPHTGCVPAKPQRWLRVQINVEQIEHGEISYVLNRCHISRYMLLSFPGLWLREEINQPESGDHDQIRLA